MNFMSNQLEQEEDMVLLKVRKPTVRFLTLGCRLNQYETQAMREQLFASGYEAHRIGSER